MAHVTSLYHSRSRGGKSTAATLCRRGPLQLPGRDEVLRNRKGIDPNFFSYVKLAAQACKLPLSKLAYPDRKIMGGAIREIRTTGVVLREMSDICDAGCVGSSPPCSTATMRLVLAAPRFPLGSAHWSERRRFLARRVKRRADCRQQTCRSCGLQRYRTIPSGPH